MTEKKIKQAEAAIFDYTKLIQPVVPDVAIGRISCIDDINNKGVMEAALREAVAKLKRLQIALQKINTADFGLCQRCRKPIPINSLMIMPDSTKYVQWHKHFYKTEAGERFLQLKKHLRHNCKMVTCKTSSPCL